MSQNKPREAAEAAFEGLQSQFYARSKAAEEIDDIARSRAAKTQRLREARLMQEEKDRMDALTSPPQKARKKAAGTGSKS